MVVLDCHNSNMKLNTIFFVVLGLFSVSMATMLQCPSTIDYHATLAEFYQATGGPTSWIHKWDITDPNICNYYGVNCAARQIDLPNNNLVGEIPDSFWCLDNFKAYNFTHNQRLTANIAKMETLRHVQFFDLSFTGIYGMLPSFEHSALNVSLKHLNLTYTCIEGPIPTTINKLAYLAALRLGKSALSGMVPLSLYDLPLKELMLECTNVDASVFDLPRFRAQKGLTIVAVPDIRNAECPTQAIIPSWCPVL